MRSPSLALVVIGRNPGTGLSRLLQGAMTYDFSDMLFVDSGSSDGSADLAERFGARTVALPRAIPGAAAARAVGTLSVRKSEWILYLDSDMVVDLAAVEHMRRLLDDVPYSVVGMTGMIRDCYPDGTSRLRLTHGRSGGRATSFGGAVVLRRLAVIEAGNWNPRVLANEELDLHARLRANGGHVRYERIVLVDHFTTLQRTSDKLAILVNWRGRAGLRYGAPGMALRSCVGRGAGFQLIALSPEPFIATPLTLAALYFTLSGHPELGVPVLAALWAWIGCRHGIQYLAPSYLLFPQIFIGMVRYGSKR